MRTLCLLLLLAPVVSSAQEVFRFTDESGATVFSDKPPPPDADAEAIALPDPGTPADSGARLDRINETATMLRDDRQAREDSRAREREEAREERHSREQEEAAKQPVIVQGGGGVYRPWRPGYGHWPEWGPGPGPGYRPRPPYLRPEHPVYRPPRPPYEPPQPSGGTLRAGPGGKGW